MKWPILVLVTLNLALWYGVEAFQAPAVSASAGSGNLPRVASLKTSGPDSERGADNAPVELTRNTPEPPPPSVEQNDVSAPLAQAESVPDPESETRPQPQPQPMMCVRLGLLPSQDVAQGLIAAQPMAGEISMAVQEVEQDLPPFHWVIIPPQPRPVALKQFRDIQRQGIDSYLVTEGENRNAISLGLFESRDAAISVLEEKKRQNLNAVLANFPRNQISYALVFKAEPDLAEDVVQAVKTDFGTDFDFVEINPC